VGSWPRMTGCSGVMGDGRIRPYCQPSASWLPGCRELIGWALWAAAARGALGHNGSVNAPPETRYARNGPIHLAYRVLDGGPPDLLVVNSGPNSHVDYMWAEPSAAAGPSTQ
jgi:hypothetical protein